MMVAELVEPIPVTGESEPIRKRGRPPKLNPDGTRANPPKLAKPRSIPKPKRAASRARGPKSLRPEIGAFLTLINSAVLMTPLGTRPLEAVTDPNVIPTRVGDELDAAEIDALASALDTQCQRSARFRKYVERMLSVGAGGQLVSVVGIIATRRAARHGLAPAALDPMLGMMLAGGGLDALGNMTPPVAPEPPDTVTGELAPDRSEPTIDFETVGTFAEP